MTDIAAQVREQAAKVAEAHIPIPVNEAIGLTDAGEAAKRMCE